MPVLPVPPTHPAHNRHMKQIKLPQTDLHASNVVLGLLRIDSLGEGEVGELVDEARAAGINMFDFSDIYGAERHDSEARFGAAVQFSSSEREKVIIQSKSGIRDGFYDFSAEHLTESVKESLSALQTDYLDLFLLHRPDTLAEPEEVAEAFDSLHDAGMVRHFGVSNHMPGQIELLKRTVRQPLVVNQMQLSIVHAPMIAQGLAANIAGDEQSADRDNDLLNYARLNDLTLQAWSPFQGHEDGAVFLGDRDNYAELNDVIDELADKHGVTPQALPVAWITRHPAQMQVIIGTTKPQRVRESAAGSQLDLSRQDWYRLFAAAGHQVP